MENFGILFLGRPNVNSASFFIFLENIIIILKSEKKIINLKRKKKRKNPCEYRPGLPIPL